MITPDPDLSAPLGLEVGDFHLSPLAQADAADVLAQFSDPEVVRFMDIEPLNSIDDAHAVIQWALDLRAMGAGVRWGVRGGRGGAWVGTCGFNRIVLERGRRGEVAFDLASAWQGRGVMKAILPALIAFGFERLGLQRLEALVTPGNQRSCHVLERAGFRREGVLGDYAYWDGRYWDQILFGLTRDREAATLGTDQTVGRSPSSSQEGGGGKSGLHGDKAAGNARRGRPQG